VARTERRLQRMGEIRIAAGRDADVIVVRGALSIVQNQNPTQGLQHKRNEEPRIHAEPPAGWPCPARAAGGVFPSFGSVKSDDEVTVQHQTMQWNGMVYVRQARDGRRTREAKP
jgi:hypothetical protein